VGTPVRDFRPPSLGDFGGGGSAIHLLNVGYRQRAVVVPNYARNALVIRPRKIPRLATLERQAEESDRFVASLEEGRCVSAQTFLLHGQIVAATTEGTPFVVSGKGMPSIRGLIST